MFLDVNVMAGISDHPAGDDNIIGLLEMSILLPEVSKVQSVNGCGMSLSDTSDMARGLILCCGMENQYKLESSSELTGDVAGTEFIGDSTIGRQISGSLTEVECGKSSTQRELEAVRRILLSCLDLLKGWNMKLHSDNKNIGFILSSGSNVEDLHSLCLNIHEICDMYKIILRVCWIPRADNFRADYLSRCFDSHHWIVSQEVFCKLNNLWGPHMVDRFSSHFNNKCDRFNSKWWVPGRKLQIVLNKVD